MRNITTLLGILFTIASASPSAFAQDDIPISSIVRARITADGDVAGKATDFLINLDVPFDGSDGWTLPQGHRMEVIIPPEFVNDRQVTNSNTGATGPVVHETVFTSNSCAIGNFFCNTGVFVQGWPQKPIANVLPPAGRASPDDFVFVTEVYTVTAGANENHFIFDAKLDVGPGSAPPGPGIKQIHMILPGFSNPAVSDATDFNIVVRETRIGDGGVVELLREGSAPFTVIPEIQPSINLTSIYDPTRANTVFQEIRRGDTPAQYEFFMWDGAGGGYDGVTVNGGDLLNASQEKIGRIRITGPQGSSGLVLESLVPSSLLDGGDIFFQLPTARLSAQVTVDDVLGDYLTEIEIFAKEEIGLANPSIVSSESLTVRVVPEPTGFLLALMSIATMTSFRRKSPTRR